MKRISIIGAGESGIGAALLAKSLGYEVFVSDSGSIADSRKIQLASQEIDFEEGTHTVDRILAADELIKSPGISFENALVKKAVGAGIPVIDELEFACRHSKGKIIAITGTNGKTTTTLLTYHLLKAAGIDAGLAGNVGQSWAAQLVDGDHAWWVLEVSSFQIDGFKNLKPDVAIIMNITPDHLDRYQYSLDNYIQSKMNLLQNMDAEGDFIYYQEDENIQKGLNMQSLSAKVHPISLSQLADAGGFFDGNAIYVRHTAGELQIAKEDVALKGNHNMLNVMSAIQAALIAGADEVALKAGLKDFKNAAHRMEHSGEVDGVVYINDSKGTNVDATAYALAAYPAPLVWIAGGVDKGNDYTQLYPFVRDHVKLLICLGKDNEKLKSAFAGIVPEIAETQHMVEAVKLAQQKAELGDIVLLSPACASFDLFKNYEDRGEQFKQAVKKLKIERE
ncbi:MAG TPA: UDP-N-acetylmuramoyl-L-alanine--D-glutamate ligase [Cyclobacteriaceae bacterium]|nr:UDP-N-acetylmuramoyl-L-alanine--D-glutamate ligase [Cyclobacteriaceae bacterium]